MAVFHEHPRRTFNPEKTARYGRPTFPVDKLVKYSPKYGWARLFNFPFRGSYWRPRMHTIVVSVDGPCKINKQSDPDSRAAWAVYFGPNDSKNSYGLTESRQPQTNSLAELEAVRQALITIRDMKLSGAFDNPFNPFKEVIIRLTSQYVVDAFHRDIWKWQGNGWQTVKGDNVAHQQLIWNIHMMICDMEENLCMAIRFWRTERDPNARNLSQRAFDEFSSSSESE